MNDNFVSGRLNQNSTQPKRLAQAIALLLSAGAALQATPVAAQLEEVTVTARKIVENLQDVPIAVTVFSEQQLNQTFAQNIREFGAYAPNVSIGTVPGFNAASIAIRGVSTGDIPSSFDPAYRAVDGFYLGTTRRHCSICLTSSRSKSAGPPGHAVRQEYDWRRGQCDTKRPSGEFGVQGKVRAANEGRLDIMGAIDFPIMQDTLSAALPYRNSTLTASTRTRLTVMMPQARICLPRASSCCGRRTKTLRRYYRTSTATT